MEVVEPEAGKFFSIKKGIHIAPSTMQWPKLSATVLKRQSLLGLMECSRG